VELTPRVTFFITGTLNTDTTNMSETGTLMTEHMSVSQKIFTS
jgi:hypothetical protein